MGIKEYNKTLTIIDATTGDIITTIKCRLFGIGTIAQQIQDIWEEDYYDREHGIVINYGIEP